MLVTLAEILNRANEGGYAVSAPNVFSDLDARACIEAAEEMRAPLIFGVAAKAVPDVVALGETLVNLVSKASVPIAIHLRLFLFSFVKISLSDAVFFFMDILPFKVSGSLKLSAFPYCIFLIMFFLIRLFPYYIFYESV